MLHSLVDTLKEYPVINVQRFSKQFGILFPNGTFPTLYFGIMKANVLFISTEIKGKKR